VSADDLRRIPLPLEREAEVNVWLLRGEPLTLVDTGPVSALALAALEDGLGEAGVRVEDLELVLLTHQHADHSGLATQIQRRSGARVAAHELLADYLERFGERVAEAKEFFARFLAEHGVPERLRGEETGYWGWLERSSEECVADLRLRDGATVRAGGRDLRVLHRPGHSETDTLFVDDANRVAFVGDHLLTTPAYAEFGPGRARPLVGYLENLRRLAGEDVGTLHTGHGEDVLDHRAAVEARIGLAAKRSGRILAALGSGPKTAFEIATSLWPTERVEWDPVLAVSDVVGHLELLAERDEVGEDETGAVRRFSVRLTST
jgi:glyoxylase-like metal-dependent hydrolase (beta-lactamase superfamily II)